tara:strand:+ start:3032 stop:3814 length:783 start_codon:yes stop_codon:yes gene_type:complete
MKDLLQLSQHATKQAADVILKYYNSSYEVKMKGKGNPVTEADIEADEILKETLMKETPDFGWLSEETRDSSDRLNKTKVWVVDPLDGTKEFVEGIPNFVISVGLVENNKPVLGIIYNPVTEQMFSAYTGGGVKLNGVNCTISKSSQLSKMSMLNSRSETKAGLWEPYKEYFNEVSPIGSIAYKLALVSTAQSDMVASLKPKNEWDICAGHCLINESGGILITSLGEKISYNNSNTLITPGLIAGNITAVQNMIDLIESTN